MADLTLLCRAVTLVIKHGPDAAAMYRAIQSGFRFGVKLPDALTLTHLRPANKTDPLVPNPHFLSQDLMRTFMGLLEPMREKLGPLRLQFGYLNRQMMGSQAEFMDRLDAFVKPRDEDLDKIAAMLKDLGARGKNAWAFVNNHFEGCAPATIKRIRERMKQSAV